MRKNWILLIAALLLPGLAGAQASATSQTNASGSANVDAKVGKKQVKASAEANAATSAQAKAGKQNSEKSGQASAKGSAQGSASTQAGGSSAGLASGTTLEAVLTKSLDARKNKEGDEITARLSQAVKSNGQVIIPKNARLIGHVTQAKARTKGESESALGFVFDKAVTKDGREFPLHVVVQAVAAAQQASAASLDNGEMDMASSAAGSMAGSAAARGGSSGGGLLGGVGSTVNTTTNTVGSVAGEATGTAGAALNTTAGAASNVTQSAAGGSLTGALTSNSSGVLGIKGLQLQSVTSSESQGSVLISNQRNVHLDSGTRLLLKATGSAGDSR